MDTSSYLKGNNKFLKYVQKQRENRGWNHQSKTEGAVKFVLSTEKAQRWENLICQHNRLLDAITPSEDFTDLRDNSQSQSDDSDNLSCQVNTNLFDNKDRDFPTDLVSSSDDFTVTDLRDDTNENHRHFLVVEKRDAPTHTISPSHDFTDLRDDSNKININFLGVDQKDIHTKESPASSGKFPVLEDSTRRRYSQTAQVWDGYDHPSLETPIYRMRAEKERWRRRMHSIEEEDNHDVSGTKETMANTLTSNLLRLIREGFFTDAINNDIPLTLPAQVVEVREMSSSPSDCSSITFAKY